MSLKYLRFASVLTPLLCAAVLGHADTASAPIHAPAFEEMLAYVYQENPQLKAERETLRTLDERVSQANAGYRPTAAINLETGEARVSQDSEPWHYGQDRNLGLVVTQPIYNGTTNGQRHAAKDRVFEGRARLLATEQKVLLTAITAWLEMFEKEELLELNRNNVQLTQNYLDATQARLNAGDGTQTDLAVAESRAAEGETRLAMAQSACDAARATYERATGQQRGSATLPQLPTDVPRSEDETMELAKKNPELEQARYEVEATQDDVDSVTGTRWPYIFLRGNVGEQNADDLGLQRLRTDSITINASVPLYQGGLEYSREREAKIAHEKSRHDSVTIARNVTEEARQAWTRFHTAELVMQTSDRSVNAADRALAGISEEQKRGTRTLTEVLDAQAQSLNTKITALQARKDLQLEAYRLLAAVGRLTAQGLNLPTKLYDPSVHYDDVAPRWFGTSIQPVDETSTNR